MRQLLYVSTASRPDARIDIDAIFERSRHNNALDGVTGLLYTDGRRFLQVIEGSDESIEQTFARIGGDNRHKDITVLIDRSIDAREFGYWAMSRRSDRTALDELDQLMMRRLSRTSDDVRAAFLDLVTDCCAA